MSKKPKLFDIRRFPMDLARVVSAPLILGYRMKRLNRNGEKYKGRIKGGAVITANHTSMQDPFLVGVAFWYRRLFFLAAEAVMRNRVLSFLLKGAGAIKIDRNKADVEAMRRSVAVLKEGRLLAIFPQGRITHEENVQTIKSGAVLIAIQAGVPIIPMYIQPIRHWYDRRTVVIGNALNPADYIKGSFPTARDIDEITKVLSEEMRRLGDLSSMEKFDKIKEIFKTVFEDSISINNITLDSKLIDDIGLNSIGMLYMAMALENEFGINFQNEDFEKIVTVGDVIACIESKVR